MASKTVAKLPAHLDITTDGDLCDTRIPYCYRHPVREKYRYTYASIENVQQLKATLRNGEWAWPGGYQMYFITSDGAALSFATVRKEFRYIADSVKNKSDDGWRVVACDINWEDNELYDDHTNEKIPAAYGE